MVEERKNKKAIQVLLKDDRSKKFTKLKKFFEKNSDVDVIRECIDFTYANAFEGPIHIKELYETQISLILKNEDLKNRYLISSRQDIINEALNLWLKTKQSELTLFNPLLRSNLPKSEKEVATILIQHQYDKSSGLNIEEIKKYLSDYKTSDLKFILKNLISMDLVKKDYIFDDDYYYIPIP